ncbi:hypothetical protein ROHU_004026 [Labeo rohita]|uniref:Uncharacterized protein n=1 Tax=Labeo rohita TaxID=84645 RepID=A0A498NR34_LABRO|nr:hypothetical protein ROHU_004026 [Labeo rohita]
MRTRNSGRRPGEPRRDVCVRFGADRTSLSHQKQNSMSNSDSGMEDNGGSSATTEMMSRTDTEHSSSGEEEGPPMIPPPLPPAPPPPIRPAPPAPDDEENVMYPIPL